MSEAGRQEPVAAAAMATGASMRDGSPAQQRRGERLRLVARILTTLGALLFAVGAWMPWVVVSTYTFVDGQRHNYTLALSPGDVEGLDGSFGWSALTAVGLLLLPLLWSRWRSRPWVSYFVFAFWAGMVGVSLPFELYFGNDVVIVPELNPPILVITHYGQWLLGFWVATVGTALIFVGVILILFPVVFRRPRDPIAQLPPAAGRSDAASGRLRVPLPGASALTIGVALWAVSTFVMPWASVDCSTTPLFFGTCTGLSYSSVLRIGIADATTAIDPLVGHYAVEVLLAGGAAMMLAGLWWRARSLAFCGWATLWLVVAAGFAWLADNGVGVVVERHEALGLQAGTWTGENAVLVSLLGFLLALVGLGYLWVDAVRHRHGGA